MHVASFPMYDLPEVRAGLDGLWAAVAAALVARGVDGVPGTLEHGRAIDSVWSDPNLLLTQCCGYDLVGRYAGVLEPIATPSYSAHGCDGCYYTSAVVVAHDNPATLIEELRGSTCAVNGFESHSGMNALRALVAPFHEAGRFFGEMLVSGDHPESVAAVASGRADIAAIDCVTYGLLQRYRPATLEGTRVLCYTDRAPGIPYVVRGNLDASLRESLAASLEQVFEQPEIRRLSQAFFIDGVQRLPRSEYDRIAEFERYAELMGYAELR